MTQSLTRDWERRLTWPLVEHLIDIIIKNPLVTYVDGEPEASDDGELASELQEFLVHLIEELEDRSTFCAETDLSYVGRNLLGAKGKKFEV